MQTNHPVTFRSLEDVQHHAKHEHLQLFVYKKVVYDLSEFIEKHPGGELEIRQFENQVIDNVIFNHHYHHHKPGIIAALQQYLYGYIEVSDKPIIQAKSSQLIIEKTRKLLKETIIQKDEDEIPEDCSIEELPYTSNQKINSSKSIS